LKSELTNLAEEVTVVDLRDRTLRTSRRIGVQRTVIGVAAAVAVLAAGAGTAFAVLPQRHPAFLPAAPSSTATASPTPTTSPATDASPASSAPTSNPPSTAFPGLYFYRWDDAAGTTKNDVLYRPAGGTWRVASTVKGLPHDAGKRTLSPDRRTVAYELSNQLWVAAVDGTSARLLVSQILDGCGGFIWSGDSRRLVHIKASANGRSDLIEEVNADGTGSRTIATVAHQSGCTLAASADGRTVAHVGDSKITLARTDGSGQRVVNAKLSDGQLVDEMVAVSPDGSRLLISTSTASAGCGCSGPQQYAVVDSASGQGTRLAQGDSSPIAAAFTDDGRVVLFDDLNRGNGSGVKPRLTLFGPDGTVLNHTDPPSFEVGNLTGLQE